MPNNNSLDIKLGKITNIKEGDRNLTIASNCVAFTKALKGQDAATAYYTKATPSTEKIKTWFKKSNSHKDFPNARDNGTTATIVFIEPVPGKKEVTITGANVGDSPFCVIQVHKERITVAWRHTPHSLDNVTEKTRVTEARTNSPTPFFKKTSPTPPLQEFEEKNNRIGLELNDSLAMTRSLGDSYFTEYGKIAEPSISQTTLPVNNTSLTLLLVGSDGLHENHIPPSGSMADLEWQRQHIKTICEEFFTSRPQRLATLSPMELATLLAKLCLEHPEDDMTGILYQIIPANEPQPVCLAIFDGHGKRGDEAASFCQKQLLSLAEQQNPTAKTEPVSPPISTADLILGTLTSIAKRENQTLDSLRAKLLDNKLSEADRNSILKAFLSCAYAFNEIYFNISKAITDMLKTEALQTSLSTVIFQLDNDALVYCLKDFYSPLEKHINALVTALEEYRGRKWIASSIESIFNLQNQHYEISLSAEQCCSILQSLVVSSPKPQIVSHFAKFYFQEKFYPFLIEKLSVTEFLAFLFYWDPQIIPQAKLTLTSQQTAKLKACIEAEIQTPILDTEKFAQLTTSYLLSLEPNDQASFILQHKASMSLSQQAALLHYFSTKNLFIKDAPTWFDLRSEDASQAHDYFFAVPKNCRTVALVNLWLQQDSITDKQNQQFLANFCARAIDQGHGQQIEEFKHGLTEDFYKKGITEAQSAEQLCRWYVAADNNLDYYQLDSFIQTVKKQYEENYSRLIPRYLDELNKLSQSLQKNSEQGQDPLQRLKISLAAFKQLGEIHSYAPKDITDSKERLKEQIEALAEKITSLYITYSADLMQEKDSKNLALLEVATKELLPPNYEKINAQQKIIEEFLKHNPVDPYKPSPLPPENPKEEESPQVRLH